MMLLYWEVKLKFFFNLIAFSFSIILSSSYE